MTAAMGRRSDGAAETEEAGQARRGEPLDGIAENHPEEDCASHHNEREAGLRFAEQELELGRERRTRYQ